MIIWFYFKALINITIDESTNLQNESILSIAQELGDDEFIHIRNLIDSKHNPLKEDEEQKIIINPKHSEKSPYEQNLEPLSIVKPSKSVWKPSIQKDKTLVKSNISESDSTKTDKRNKER